jgi:hypothetical protein
VTVTSPAVLTFRAVAVVGEDPLGLSEIAASLPATFSFTIPTDIASRRYMLTADGETSSGQAVQSATVRIAVERADMPLSVAPLLPQIVFETIGEQATIELLGTFPDGSVHDVSESSKVTYSSRDPNIASVDASGTVTAVAAGTTSITAVYSEGAQSVRIEIPVTVPKPVLTASHTALSFGDQEIGAGSVRQVTLVNDSTDEMSIMSVETSGDFSEMNDCVSSPIPAGAGCTITVTFQPSEAGPADGTLSVANSFNSVPVGIMLSGTGIAPQRALTAATPAHLWVGLKNGNSARLGADIRVELLVNQGVVAGGMVENALLGGSRYHAVLHRIETALADGEAAILSGAEIGLRVSVRRACSGRHGRSSRTVRLWYGGKGVDRGGRFDGDEDVDDENGWKDRRARGFDAASRIRLTIADAVDDYFLSTAVRNYDDVFFSPRQAARPTAS